MVLSARRVGSNFNLGGEQAEADPLLKGAFYESDDYRTIASKVDQRCFLIARTGSGKSAALQRLEEDYPDHVVRIAPEDLSLPYITNTTAMRYLEALGVSPDPFFIALWKHVLLIELIRHRYKVNSPEAKTNFMSILREKIKRDPAKRAALDYLEEFEDRFWVETDERVREITDKFEQRITSEAKGKLGFSGSEASGGSGHDETASSEVKSELSDRFQRIVNETQLARLNKMIKVLDEDILDSRQNFTYVVIDDLDRDWVDDGLANGLIRCLFRTVLDLQRVQNLKIIVALRTNIFENLDFGHRGGGQEEKFRSLVLNMKWSSKELEELSSERLRVAAEPYGIAVKDIHDVLPNPNPKRGKPFDYLLTRTLMRPRDTIAFINECFTVAEGGMPFSWEHISTAENAYSIKRLYALRDEWKVTYPGIDKVFQVFVGAVLPLSRADFTDRLDDVAMLLAHPAFSGHDWLASMTSAIWRASSGNWVTWYGPTIRMLYDIGFLGFTSGIQKSISYAQSAPDFAVKDSNLEAAQYFSINPTFQHALDVRVEHTWVGKC